MKYIGQWATLLLLSISQLLSAQTAKHLWQLYEPTVLFNPSGQMSVFTYDRLSIYNVETGFLEKSYDLLANRSPYIWPTTSKGGHSDDFRFYHFYGQNKDLSGNRGVFVRFDTETQKWETISRYDYPRYSYRGMDTQGREVVADNHKKVTLLYKPNGKKIKEIADEQYVNVLSGGRFGTFKKNDQFQLIDFDSDITKPLNYKKALYMSETFPEWLINKDGEQRTLFNPYTKQEEIKDANDKNKEIPAMYVGCVGKFSKAIYYGKYVYQVVKDSTEISNPDQNGAVPFLIKQFDISTCNLIKTFAVSVSRSENEAKLASVANIYDGVKLMDAKYKAENKAREDWDAASKQKFEDRKVAQQLAKELFINFQDGGTSFGVSLLGLRGRDITNLPYVKKYLGHLRGEITAVVKFSRGQSIILVVAVKNGNDLAFKFINVHYEGAYKSTTDIASVYNVGNLISQNLVIGFSNPNGMSVKADVTKTYQATGKKQTSVIYAP